MTSAATTSGSTAHERTFMGVPVPEDQVVVGFDQPGPAREWWPVGHPVGDALAVIDRELDRITDSGMWTLQPGELRALLRQSARVVARVEELSLRVARAAERADVGAADASTSTAVWWANATMQTTKACMAKIRLAKALDHDHEPVRDALAAGELVLEQAEVIVGAVQALRTGEAKDLVDPHIVGAAERTLIELAREHDAKALRVLGRRILDIVAPEVGEAHEARLLAKEERDAASKARLTMREDGHGSTFGRFTLPDAHAAMLRKQLMALAAPFGKAPAAHGEQTAEAGGAVASGRAPLFGPDQLGRAFMTYLERYPSHLLPTAGGVAADVVVTVDLDTLISGLGSARLDTGNVISPTMARMWACEAQIIPMVMGGKSEVLDCGRGRRFHTRAQRRVKIVEQGGCTTEGCDYPPGLCHVHHEIPWGQGGGTNTKDARLLCPKHHHRAHDPAYSMARLPTGKVTFNRRT